MVDHKRIGPAPASSRAQVALALGLAALRRVGAAAGRVCAALARPGAVVLQMLAAGLACAVCGVWMLAGTPWALLTAAAILFVLAGLAMRGMFNG